jgi:glycosyltransferase involved in cell wall biosynthesis
MPDGAILSRLGLAPHARYFLVIGSASDNKNQQTAIRAFASIAGDAALHFVVAGDRNEAVFVADQGVPDDAHRRVIRAGRVTDSELRALYDSAVALVFPSRAEGFGLPPLEAMVSGCPVIAARRAALPEVCGDAALYVDPDNVDDIAAAMRRLLSDADLRERLRESGHQRARNFTWRISARTLLSHLTMAGLIDGVKWQ